MNACACFTVPTDGPETCGWCGILPPAAIIGPAPTSLVARLAPALANIAVYERLARDPMLPAVTVDTLRWLASEARLSMRSSAELWAIGA